MSTKRNRAWRRFINRINCKRGMGTREKWKPEKKWKMVYLRSAKLARAGQLGFEYPRRNYWQLLERELLVDE